MFKRFLSGNTPSHLYVYVHLNRLYCTLGTIAHFTCSTFIDMVIIQTMQTHIFHSTLRDRFKTRCYCHVFVAHMSTVIVTVPNCNSYTTPYCFNITCSGFSPVLVFLPSCILEQTSHQFNTNFMFSVHPTLQQSTINPLYKFSSCLLP